MRLPFITPRHRVEMMSPGATVEWMRSYSQRLTAEAGEKTARGLIDAFLRDQKRPRQERREWLAFLFEGAPSHPAPFAMTGEEAQGPTWTDHRLAGLVRQKDWAGVERHLLGQGWSADAVAETITHLTQGPPPDLGKVTE